MCVAKPAVIRSVAIALSLMSTGVLLERPAQAQGSSPFIKAADTREITSGELVRVKKLRRDMANVHGSISTTGPSQFQDQPTLQKYIKRFGQFTDAIKKYYDFQHAEVLAAREDYVALRKTLSAEHARAKQQAGGLGDVQAELRAMEVDLQAMRAPNALTAPFSAETARLWVKAAVDAKTTAQSSLKRLPEISQTARLDKNNPGTVQQGSPYDHQDINRLTRLAQGTINKIDQSRDTTMANLKAQLAGSDNELNYFRGLDASNDTHRMNAFLKDGAPEEMHSRLDEHLKISQSAAHFMGAFGKAPSEKVQGRIDEINQLKVIYDVQLEKAAGAYKLPTPVSTDDQLLAIAKQVIEKPKYEFGQHGPIVLTTDKITEHEREESELEFTDVDVSLSGDITLTGTETTWTYRWQEFKFATPLQEQSGKWYVWWITARNFSSGGNSTPIGEWVSGKAVKGSAIREENF